MKVTKTDSAFSFMKTKECETVINLINAAKAFHKTFILNWKSIQKIITNECIIRLSEGSK